MQFYPLSVLTLIVAAAGAFAQTESGSETSSGSAGGSGSATPTRSGSASRSSGASSTVSANPSSFPTLTPYSDCGGPGRTVLRASEPKHKPVLLKRDPFEQQQHVQVAIERRLEYQHQHKRLRLEH
ncbi:hypothetical protein EV121DRAFT_268988 [Schizophyllum commune]